LLWDRVEDSFGDPELCETGVKVFDSLEPPAKLAMLASVAEALHDEHVACLELTALSEGTFAAVYATIREWVEIQIDQCKEDPSAVDDEPSMRALVIAAHREAQAECAREDAEYIDTDKEREHGETHLQIGPASENSEVWGDLLEELMDQVLWGDRDFEDGNLMLDADPDLGSALKSQLGIDEDYYITTPPEPSTTDLRAIRESLRRLCGRSKSQR
jgi:hypothetical protein